MTINKFLQKYRKQRNGMQIVRPRVRCADGYTVSVQAGEYHYCSPRADVDHAAENLKWVTSSENQKHAVENGLQPKPGKTYEGKFTAEQRAEIKRVWDSGVFSKRRIAKEYGVSHSCICSIVNDKYKYAETVNLFEEIARPLVDTLNELRDSYLACDDADAKKRIWYAMIQLLPQSYNQRRTLMLNYEVLATIYRQRKDHRLNEWQTFCEWIETLPYAELIVGR